MKKLNLKSEIVLWVIILVPLIYLALVWDQVQEQEPVPNHTYLYGIIDDWSNEFILASAVFLIMAGTAGIYFFMLFLPKLDPKGRIESMGNTYYRLRILMVLYTSALATYVIYIAANPGRIHLNLLPFLTGALFIVCGNYLPAVKPNYYIGIRTSWTLESENVWRKTHRFSGPIFIAGGILYILVAFIGKEHFIPGLILSLLALVTVALAPVIYSYIEFKKEQKMKHNA